MRFQVYNENTILNLEIQNATADWLEQGKLTPPQYEQVKTAFPTDFKQTNLFVRLGLFVFTGICCGSALGLAALLFADSIGQIGWNTFLILFGVLTGFVNESLIQSNKWYRNGSDNALCYFSVMCLSMGICFLLDIRSQAAVSLIFLITISLFTVRYGDPFLAFAAFYALIYLFYTLVQEAELGSLLFGLIMAIPAVATYFLAKKGQSQASLFYWEDCFVVLEIAGLVGIYGALNYSFVDGLGNSLSTSEPSRQYPSVFFAFTTALLPLIYLFVGIGMKDRILWILGGLGIAASIMTYRLYHAIMPIEWACTLAGIALLVLAIGLMRYLKTPRNGFVYAPQKAKSNLMESLVMNQILQQPNAPQADNRVNFGGGDFDGGGAGNEY